jgi:hypothetical protein
MQGDAEAQAARIRILAHKKASAHLRQKYEEEYIAFYREELLKRMAAAGLPMNIFMRMRDNGK